MKLAASPEAKTALGLHHTYRLSDSPTEPVVFLVHGRAGNTDVMWAFNRCIPEQFTVFAPEAPLPDPIGGFSWWHVESQTDQESVQNALTILTNFIVRAPAYYGLTPRALIGIGFSQGAGVLSALTLRNPAKFTGLALLAGFVVKRHGRTKSDASDSAPLPTVYIAHGTLDEVVPVESARAGKQYLEQLGFQVQMEEDAVSHKIGTRGMRGLTAWMHQFL